MAESGATEALAALAAGDARHFAAMEIAEQGLRNALRRRGRQAGDKRNRHTGTQSITHLAHEAAYEHWHRMLFARFLAENELLIAPEYGVAVSLEDCRELAREEGRDPWELAGEWAQTMLPEIFGIDDPVLELTVPPETRQKLEALLESLPPQVFTAQDSLGWTYQYWRADEKDRVNTSGVKIGADELPAVTQLFTERYMVRFLLQNTVGAWRAGKVLADEPELAASAPNEEALRRRTRLETGGGYDFAYLRFVRAKAETDEGDERTGPWRPAAGSFPDWPRMARDLRILDPCCGSGHFLVEAFELVVRLRMEEEELAVSDAVRAVLHDNLFGLEIDPRCTQIAAFNLALAAWRMAGEWIELPRLSVACCGIAPAGSESGWVRLAEKLEGLTGLAEDPDLFGTDASLARGPLQEGMARLHRLFGQARELGSLIEPEAVGGDLFRAGYDDLKKLLSAAVGRERKAMDRDERAVAAAGMARAAEILTGRYTLVVTNVPFLARGKQGARLREFAETHHGDAKGDIATVFASRIFRWLGDHGTQALVTPQNWLFLSSYSKLRERLLEDRTWNVVARLGPGAFETISGEVVAVALVVLSAEKPEPDWEMAGVDVSTPQGQRAIKASEKAKLLRGLRSTDPTVPETAVNYPVPGTLLQIGQYNLRSGNHVVVLNPDASRTRLGRFAKAWQGLVTGDDARFLRKCWEQEWGRSWIGLQRAPQVPAFFSGRDTVIFWQAGKGQLHRSPTAHNFPPAAVLGRSGVAIQQMSGLLTTLYTGDVFGPTVAPLMPIKEKLLPTIWSFCSSDVFCAATRAVNPKINVTPGSFGDVPFDLDHWTKVAAERYPNGLPEPYSDDPTQWIFHGDPCRSVIWDEGAKLTRRGPTRFDHTVLQAAVARLLGYRWPAELDPEMRLAPEQRSLADRCAADDDLADADGIVCLSPARGEVSAADRLRELLIRAYGDEWSAATERRLLAATNPNGRAPKSLEDWLANKFFGEHCRLFHNRPFIWHIWDGAKDGFHALVSYHRLAGPGGEGRRTLESLAYVYLNDWIHRQRVGQSDGVPGSDARLAHALDLQQQLERIVEGEPPCDLFVRWKPLRAQAIGWEPDLDDGVRLNIRPFMRAELRRGGRAGAGILRWKPNIKWGKDRGKEPAKRRPREEFPWFHGCPGLGGVEARTDFPARKEAEFDGNRWNDLHYTRSAKQTARNAGTG